MERQDNKKFKESAEWDEMITYMKDKLVDSKFDAFKNMYK